MNRLLFLFVAAFFTLALSPKVENISDRNLNDARQLVNGRCKAYLAAVQGKISNLFKDEECNVAAKIVADDATIKSITMLIESLEKLKGTLPSADSYSEDEKLRYVLYSKSLREDNAQVEELIEGCLQDKDKAAQNRPACRVATEIMLEKLTKEQTNALSNVAGEDKSKENSKRYFEEHPDEIKKVLDGKCKDILKNPWYKFDDEMRDVQCDTALVISRQNSLREKELAVVKTRKEVKDKTYFIKNYSEAELLSASCKNGKVENLEECEASMHVVTEKTNEESKKVEYIKYYNGHPMAAKFFVRWCKNSMLNFNVKCQAAEGAVKLYSSKKQKVYKDELVDKYVEKFKAEPEKAKELLVGKCKVLFEDPWYFLDESIRSEQCDAAVEIARLVVEVQNKKKEAASKLNAEKPLGN